MQRQRHHRQNNEINSRSLNKPDFQSYRPAKDNSQRQLKVANLIKEALVEVLRNGKGLDVALLSISVTVSKINISSDLRIAHCYILPFGVISSNSVTELLEALERSKYAIRALVTKKINLRYSPNLIFVYDDSFDKIHQLNQAMKSSSIENNAKISTADLTSDS